jgi:hypothetical protein
MAPGDETTQRRFTLWHESFYACITERAPPGFDIVAEYLLSLRPRRADLLLLRRSGEPHRDQEAHLLRGLWPRLSQVTLIELKSPVRGFRRSEFLRLCGYGLQYHERNLADLPHASALTLVLILPSLNQAFRDELAALRCALQPLGGGYAEVVGFSYSIYVVCTDEVAEAEQDDFLRIYSHRTLQTEAAREWLEAFILRKRDAMPDVTEREDYDEMLDKLLASLPPERVLRNFEPEERLAGLAPEQVLAYYKAENMLPGMPIEVLRALSEDYLRTLPEPVQQAIRRRLAAGS